MGNQDGNTMRGVKHELGMLFTHEGRITRHMRAPNHQRQARASTEKLGRIGRGEKGFDGPSRLRLKQPRRSPDSESAPHCSTTASGRYFSMTLPSTVRKIPTKTRSLTPSCRGKFSA